MPAQRKPKVLMLGVTAALKARFAKVKLLLCDVDGVLTDGALYIGLGAEVKRFHILDGLGLVRLRRNGIQVGWVSSRPSPATARRARELKIDYLAQDKRSKVEAVSELLARAKLDWSEVCYVGDDIVDLGVMRRAGVAVAVANAVEEVKRVAHCLTWARGGNGAVREVAEVILDAQGKWDAEVQRMYA